jgi:sialidase-1
MLWHEKGRGGIKLFGWRTLCSCDWIDVAEMKRWNSREVLVDRALAAAVVFLAVASGFAGAETDLFVAGTESYHTYRIPAVVTSAAGTVLAFCEGRKKSSSDTGDVDLLVKRSTDGGETWSEQKLIWSDAENVCGNPAPVLDRDTGTVWLLLTWNRGSDTEKAILEAKSKDTRRVFITHSTNDGVTWDKPREITESVKKPGWRWYATGPVNGIQLARGKYKGRLVVPANHSDHSDPTQHPFRSHAIYSDDHGATWRIGGVEEEKTNESTIVELADGTLLHNMRSYHGKNRRAVARSSDGGLTWSALMMDPALIEPVCQASILRHSWPDAERKGVILFSNPASTRREKMTVRLSEDDGANWPVSRELWSGPAAYSCLTLLPNGIIGCLYERGETNPYQKIVFARFTKEWLRESNR